MFANKKEFYGGAAMMAGFLIVLFIMFLPLLDGHKNGLNYLDDLFNSISKGSAYYIPKMKAEIAKTKGGKPLALDLSLESEALARESALLFLKSGATVTAEGKTVKISGDLTPMLANCLEDADTLFHNDGKTLQAKYGIEGRKALFVWYKSLIAMQKALSKQKRFSESKVVHSVTTRAVECAYNYYQVVPKSMSQSMVPAIFALIFYVIYTIWYGFSILYLFEGWGLKISH
jgi:hypothetical protein